MFFSDAKSINYSASEASQKKNGCERSEQAFFEKIALRAERVCERGDFGKISVPALFSEREASVPLVC